MNNNIIKKEIELCIKFFQEVTNNDIHSPGYGLMLDRTNDLNCCSIAAVGFALSSYPIAVEHKIVSYEAMVEKTIGTLKTLLKIDTYYGFFPHFVDFNTAQRYIKSEFSTVDTALLLCGIITVQTYFKDNQVINDMSNTIINNVKWYKFIVEEGDKAYFHMSYNDYSDGEYANGSSGYISKWTMLAEQLMMYFLATNDSAISDEMIRKLYLSFDRTKLNYGGYDVYVEPAGTLFTYHYSHAWLNFKAIETSDKIDFFENSKNATLAQIAWINDNKDQYETFKKGYWGLSAFDGVNGYIVSGAYPATHTPYCEGSIGPSAIAGSCIFTPEISINTLEKLYNEVPEMFGEYGFKDGYNADPYFVAKTYLGIDKGITLLMLDNYLNGTNQNLFMNSPLIKNAIERLDFKLI